jgi:hypothetical protein
MMVCRGGTVHAGPLVCRQAPRVSKRAQDAIPDPQRTQVVTEYLFQDFPGLFQVRLVFPLRFLVSETSHTSVYLLRVSCMPHSYMCKSLTSFRAWIDPTSKKEGHCDITARTVLLYVLFCLIYMYCPLYVLYILHTVHTVHVPCFPFSDVEVSSSTSVHTLVHTSKFTCVFTYHLCSHRTYLN